VRVSRDEEQGLGFLIKSGGYVITSRQLVDQSQKLQVTAEDGNSLPAKVIATSEEDDLALIQITLADHPVVAFRTQEVKNGLAVSSMGYAAPDSSSTSMMLASVARNDLPFRNRIVYVLAMTAQHCGGGPVVDQTGRLVGMLSVVKGETDLENQVLAIPSGIIAAFVQKHIR
jgi:serine protease Do